MILEDGSMFYGEDDFVNDTSIIAKIITTQSYKFDVIVALGRGGIPFGSKLSYLLRKPLYEVQYSLKDESRYENLNAILPDIKGKKILIVDDISDSGLTLAEIAVKLQHEQFETATLIYKPRTSIYEPTFFAREHSTDKWVTFFWEI